MNLNYFNIILLPYKYYGLENWIVVTEMSFEYEFWLFLKMDYVWLGFKN